MRACTGLPVRPRHREPALWRERATRSDLDRVGEPDVWFDIAADALLHVDRHRRQSAIDCIRARPFKSLPEPSFPEGHGLHDSHRALGLLDDLAAGGKM